MKRTVTISGVAAHQLKECQWILDWCSEGISLKSKMKVGVYPTWSYNFEDLVVGIGAGAISKTSIRQQISHAEKTYPAVCGVKATSTLEGSTAKIEATVQFQQAGNYKIACVLVENNIENKETYNTFNHVLRAAQTDMEGDAVTPAVTAPEERTFNFEATIGEDWNAENCASWFMYSKRRPMASILSITVLNVLLMVLWITDMSCRI